MLFPNGETPVTISLYKNVPFDNKYEHHLFRDVEFTNNLTTYETITMQDFLDMKKSDNTNVYPKLEMSGEYNFDYANGLVTRVVLTLHSDFTDCNYMVVESGSNIFYFFITSAVVKSSNNVVTSLQTFYEVTVQFELELDVLATYGKSFMDSVKGVPVFTERKHCQRFAKRSNPSEPIKFYCSDLVTSEDVTLNCKPNIIKEVKEHKQDLNTGSSEVKVDMLWAYITSEVIDLYEDNKLPVKITGVTNPVSVIALPLCEEFEIIVPHAGETHNYKIKPQKLIGDIFDELSVYQIKFSPIPPFNSLYSSYYGASCIFNRFTLGGGGTKILLTIPEDCVRDSSFNPNNGIARYDVTIGDNDFVIYHGSNSVASWETLFTIQHQKSTEVYYKNSEIEDFTISGNSLVNKNEKAEPKLLFYPCRKYELYQRFGSPVEVHPELIASKYPLDSEYLLKSYSTASFQSNTISTYIHFNINSSYENFNKYYPTLNKGLVNNCDYNFPVGTDALKTFMQTQSSSYANQTIGKVIGSLIATAGGGLMLAGGNILGAGAIAGGLTNMVTSITGVSSKINDLGNTPDKISNNGTSLYQDYGILYDEQSQSTYSDTNLNPRLVITELTPSEKEILLDYFYHYGYNVQRQCNFNTEIACNSNGYTSTNWVDNRIITRRIFNYVKLNENLRYKLVNIINNKYDIPPIICEKLTNIFNNGVTLWTLFNIENKANLNWNNIENFFMRDTLANNEVDM